MIRRSEASDGRLDGAPPRVLRGAARWCVLLAACAAALLGLATAAQAEVGSDAACNQKAYKDCYKDTVFLLRWPIWLGSYAATSVFGGTRVDLLEEHTAHRWYMTDLPNDVFLRAARKKATGDSYFTGGFRYQHLFVTPPEPVGDKLVTQNAGLAVGMEVYTASDIRLQIDPDSPPSYERPYAGVFYIAGLYELIRVRADRTGSQFWGSTWGPSDQIFRFEWAYTAIGPYSQAGAAQIALHDVFSRGSPTPQGWDTQIQEQYGIDVSLGYAHSLLTWSLGGDSLPFLNVVGLLKARYGVTHVNTEVGLRAYLTIFGARGWFDGDRFLTTLEGNPLQIGTDCECRVALGLHAGRILREVGHNTLLEGRGSGSAGRIFTFHREDSPHTVRAKGRVYDTERGIALALGQWRIGYTEISRDGEIDDPNAIDRDGQRIGVVSIVYEKQYD